jgi:hypothetical protein
MRGAERGKHRLISGIALARHPHRGKGQQGDLSKISLPTGLNSPRWASSLRCAVVADHAVSQPQVHGVQAADRKWFARICVSAVLVDTLIQIDPRFPAVTPARRQELLIVKDELEAEAPRGAAADPFTAQQEREQARGIGRAGRPGAAR